MSSIKGANLDFRASARAVGNKVATVPVSTSTDVFPEAKTVFPIDTSVKAMVNLIISWSVEIDAGIVIKSPALKLGSSPPRVTLPPSKKFPEIV